MDWLRTILWASVVVVTTISVIAHWKVTSLNKLLGNEVFSQMSTPTLEELEEARAAQAEEGTRVGPLELKSSEQGMGRKDGEYFFFDVLTDEKLPYPPTAADIRLFDLGEKMYFWLEVRRYSPIAAAALLLGALALQFGLRVKN